MNKIAASGFTLAEMLITVTILGIVAVAAVPLLSSNDPQKLNVAASETANLLRFALSVTGRCTDGYVLVDGKTTANHLVLYCSDKDGNRGQPITDPLTKRAMDINVSGNTFSSGVSLTPQFMDNNTSNKLLLIRAVPLKMQSLDSNGNPHNLDPPSGVKLSYGHQSVTVSIDEKTGRVSLP